MRATVKTETSFWLTVRKKFVLVVTIIEGNIIPGMLLKSEYSDTTMKIESIEFVDSAKSHIGLVFEEGVNDEFLNNIQPDSILFCVDQDLA